VAFIVQNALGGLAYGGLLFLIASGFTLIFGLMRVVNLAQTALYLIGAYIGLTLLNLNVNFWLAAVVAGLVVMVLGVVIYALLHRFHKQDLTVLLLTLGISLMLDDLALAIWGGNPESISAPQNLAGSVSLLGAVFPVYWLVLLLLSVVIAALLWLFQQRTRMGAIIRAGVDDEEMVQGLGVNVNRAFYLVFALGAFLAGAAGVLGGPILGVAPGLDASLLALAFAVIIVGGMGSLTGAFVGSMVIGLINNFGQALFPQIAYFTIFAPVALIIALRPQGLFGRKQAS
jgi:branched-chain amino acid transport system permease protein